MLTEILPATLNNCNSFSNLLHCSNLCLVYTLLKLHLNGPVDNGLNITFGGCSDDAQDVKLMSSICSVQLVCTVRFLLKASLKLWLNHIRPMLHVCRNQLIDLQCKSFDWFLYSVTMT